MHACMHAHIHVYMHAYMHCYECMYELLPGVPTPAPSDAQVGERDKHISQLVQLVESTQLAGRTAPHSISAEVLSTANGPHAVPR